MTQGDWTRASIQRDRTRIAAAYADREERLAHHAKYGERMCDGSLYLFGMCGCWGCRGPWKQGDGTGEHEGQE